MLELLKNCKICPQRCGVNRISGEQGQCRASGKIIVSKAFLHQWEEPCISGTRGSGTVFFSGCNMSCCFCQNYSISQQMIGKEITIERLAEIFMELEQKGAHNINLVSPTPYALHIIEAVKQAKALGLKVPVIYNTNGYELPETINMLKDTVNVFLPDIKFFDVALSKKYSKAKNYFDYASKATLTMIEKVGHPVFDEEGMITSGVIIRHLIMPSLPDNSKKILEWIKKNIGSDAFVSLMGQYTPIFQANNFPEINRKLEEKEYDEIIEYFFKIGLENGFAQELSSASENYIPNFDFEGI